MKKHFIWGMVLFVTLVFCCYLSTSVCAASAEDEVLQVATNFVKAINDNNAEALSSLWNQAPTTTTFGPWGRFLKHEWLTSPPPGVSFALTYPEAAMLGDNAAVITGYFTVTTSNEKTNEIKTEYFRETLVVQKIKGKWLIVHEHCSTQP
jgi:hypothetical protein